MKLSLPQYELFKSTKQIRLLLAGNAFGKTFLEGVLTYNLIQQFPNVKGFIGANTYDQLNTSTFFRIREVWKSFGIKEYDPKHKTGHYVVDKKPPDNWPKQNHNFKDYNNIVSFCNGWVGFLGSLDNALAHEGKEFGWAVLDETKDSKETDVKDIILSRLRQQGIFVDQDGNFTANIKDNPICPLFIVTMPAKTDWINEWFKLDNYINEIQGIIYRHPNDYPGESYFKKEFDNKQVIIANSFHNEDNLPANYLQNKKLDWPKSTIDARLYANPFTSTGGEYFSSFVRELHVKENQYNPDYPLHISFDFNAIPYNSLGIFQIIKEGNIYNVYGLDEICLPNPNNSVEEICDAFIFKYESHQSSLLIYGDASGRNRTITNKLFKHNYKIIEYKLAKFKCFMKVPLANPPNIARRDFFNKIFENKTPIRLYISPKMRNLVADFIYCKQDIDGTKDKHRVKDSLTGLSYEKFGHMSDLTEYFLCEAFKIFFKP